MKKVSERLRDLDRRVAGHRTIQHGDGWRKAISGWRFWLGYSVFVAVVLALNVLVGNKVSSIGLLPLVVITAFQAGRLRGKSD